MKIKIPLIFNQILTINFKILTVTSSIPSLSPKLALWRSVSLGFSLSLEINLSEPSCSWTIQKQPFVGWKWHCFHNNFWIIGRWKQTKWKIFIFYFVVRTKTLTRNTLKLEALIYGKIASHIYALKSLHVELMSRLFGNLQVISLNT